MSTNLARIPLSMAAFAWPPAAELAGLAEAPAAACAVLCKVLREAIRVFGADYGRLCLGVGAVDVREVTCCATRQRCVAPVREYDAVERNAAASRTGALLLANAPIPYFCDHLGLTPITGVMAVPLLREDAVIGALSLGYIHPPVLTHDELGLLAGIADRLVEVFGAASQACPSRAMPDGLDSLCAQVPWAVIAADLQGTVCTANGAAEELFLASAAQLAGKPLTALLRLDDVQADGANRGASHVLRPDGTELPVEFSTSLLTLGDGQRLRVVALHDVSKEQEQLEERLRHAELEGIFRTIATVNHEINNPLFGMMATVQLLEAEIGDYSPSVRKRLALIAECCDRIKQLTDNLSRVAHPASRTYVAGEGMLDLVRAARNDADAGGAERADEVVAVESHVGSSHVHTQS